MNLIPPGGCGQQWRYVRSRIVNRSVSASPVDVLVVGAGVVGATVAMEAARSGRTVTVVDAAGDVGGGCSYANAALLAPDHVTPLATPAALRDAGRQLVRRPPALTVRPQPSLLPWLTKLALSARGKRARAGAAALSEWAHRSADRHAAWAADGRSSTFNRTGAIDIRLRRPGGLTPAELIALEPSLGAVAGGVHHRDEAVTESRTYVREMLAQARAHGARIEFGQRVEGLERRGDRVTGVRVATGVVPADQVVLCTGLAADLAAEVGLRLPLRGGRGYVIDLQPSGDTPRMAVRLPEHRVVVTPLADRVRVAGAMDFGREGRPVDLTRARQLVGAAARGIPALAERPVIDLWAGERPCTSDGLPIIGRTEAAPRLSLALGHGMWGLILAPVTAEQIIAGFSAAPEPDHPFSPDRF